MFSKQTADRAATSTTVAQSNARWLAVAVALLSAGCDRSTSKPVDPLTVPAVAAAGSGTVAAPAASAPSTVPSPAAVPAPAADPGPFQLAATCRGSCSVALSPLAGERALALWEDTDGTWVQRFDLARGSSLGAQLALGKLAAEDRPYVFALPDGDAALFGVLSDGGVSFARGSEVAARRIAPKVAVLGGRPGVRSLAASATGEGLVLLVLRGLDEQQAHAEKFQMEAELHWLDARGEALRAPLSWRTRVAGRARLAACGQQLFLAWSSVEGVVVTRVSGAGQAREEAPFPAPTAKLEVNLGPLSCTATGASLVAGWEKHEDFIQVQRKVSVATISATGALPQRGRWTMSSLPGDPQSLPSNELPLAAYASGSDVKLLVDEDYFVAVVGVDPLTGKVNALPGSPQLPRGTPCLPTSAGRRALCVKAEVSQPMPECKEYVQRLTALFVGEPPSATNTAGAAVAPEPYFASGGAPLPATSPRPKPDAVARSSQLWCGDPGWGALRKAIETYCDNLGKKHEATRKKTERKRLEEDLKGYCGTGPSSLPYQAAHCTDEPLVCGHPSVSNLLTVDRAEFEKGSTWLMMEVFHNCQVWFSGKGDTWSVVSHECNGD